MIKKLYSYNFIKSCLVSTSSFQTKFCSDGRLFFVLLFTLISSSISFGQNRVVKPHDFYNTVKPEDYKFYGGDTLKEFDLKGTFEKAKAMNCSSNELHNYMLTNERIFMFGKYRKVLLNSHYHDPLRIISRYGEHEEPSEADKAKGIKTMKDEWLDNTKKSVNHQAFGGGCNNLDFSNVGAPYTNWTAAIGVNNYAGDSSIFTSWGNWQFTTAQLNTQNTTPPASGTPATLGENAPLNSCSWVTICTTGTDSCGPFPMVCPGFTASCRLGGNFVNLDPGIGGGFSGCGSRGTYAYDASTGKDTVNGVNTSALVGGGAAIKHEFSAQGEVMEQAIPITAANSVLTINYAAVLNDGGHPSGEQPFVFFCVYDQANKKIPCLEYYQEAVAGAFPPGFKLGKSLNWIQDVLVGPGANGGGNYQTACYYKPWTAASFDMTRYIGQTVTFQAIACGCWPGGHFAYVYIDISCGPQQIAVANTTCGSGTITAPSGDSSYHWIGPGAGCITAGTNSQTATVKCSGTYSCVAVLAGGKHCADTIVDNVTIVSDPTPTITASPSSTICSGGSTTLSASAGGGFVGTYTWSTGVTASSITVSPASTATYTVTATTTSLSCTGSSTITVNVNTTPTITVSATPTTTVCSGTTVTLKALGGTGGTTYVWAGGTIPTTGATVTATPTTTTTYTVTPSNGTCTGAPVTITITVNPTPTVTASASPSATICAGSSVKLTANPSGLASYSWTPTVTLTTTTYDTTTASPTVTTTYTVVGTTAAGCSNTTPATVKVTVNTTPTVNIGVLPSTSICSGTTAFLSATGATTYLWSTGSTLSTIAVTPLATTTYTVTGTNAAGCSGGSATKTTTITVTTTPTVVVNPISPIGLCPGDTAKITASGATTYSWNTGQTTDTIMAHPAGSTTYTVTGANGVCTDKVIITVNVGVINVTATASSLSVCKGQPDTIKASGAVTYIWNTGNTNSNFVITATKDTSFSVKGTSGSGCNGTATVSIKVNSVASITASTPSPGTVCPGDTTQAYVTLGSAGTPPYTFNWSTTPVQTNDTARGLGAGTYTVSVTDANHCTSDTATVIITTKNISVSASAAPSSTICAGNSTTLTATGATNYIWSTGATTSTITISPGVDSTFKVIGTTTGTCKDSDTVAIKVNPLPNVTVKPSDSAICSGQSTVLTASGASSYTWLPSTTPSSGSPVTATPTTNTTYSVIGKSAAGCVDTATVYITVNATPTASIKITGGNDTICPGKSVILTASGGSTYTWSGGTIPTTGAVVSVKPTTNPTTYTVTAISTNGACKDVATQSIYIFPTLSLNINGLDSICNGQFDTLMATLVGGNPLPGYTYKWNPPIGTGPGPYVVKPSTSTTYSCTVTDGCNNSASNVIVVDIRPSPTAKFTATPNPVGAGEFVAFIDSSTNASAWYWTFGDGNTSTSSFPYNQYLAAGNYVATLWVTSSAGCRDSLSDTIHVIEIIYVPNVFTPNGDGQNDVFHVTANDMKVYTIHIFNRWGQEVFNAADPNIDWDGRSPAGVQESDGIYYYIIKATDYSNKSYDFNGYLQLIR